MSLNEIIFEHIDDKYAYGKYADFKVIIMKENRYINATNLCNNNNRKFKNWLKTDHSKNLISEVDGLLLKSIGNLSSRCLSTEVKPSIIKITGGNSKKENIRGTYVHELLIPHIASWISPEFGIMVSQIVNSYIVSEYTKTINIKDDKIAELLKRLDESDKRTEKRVKKVLDKLDDNTVKLDEARVELTETRLELKSTNKQLTNVSKKLDVAVEDRVPKPENTNKLEEFVLLKNRRKKADYKYYAVRGQTSYTVRKTANKIDDKYKEILRFSNVANSVNLWNRLKEALKKKVDYCGNEMNLINVNEEQFIETIRDIYEKRKFVDIKYNQDEETSDSD